ncbi:AraC family transcriptional regulator [Pinibacter soli]|uniref:AraC family transcriptional regulator n=1 Tax=Pinibacter soli TaxID=3044211 RepID=A0ABT6RJK1_9BACT|nr:AraC family transcriptional regulator [Pinibacter soli]MDI3322022.1 AraC family transcriptional regulator [Pinibacter soli]
MPSHNYLNTISLTPRKELQTFVEHRRVFNLNNCELNIFESYEETYRVPLTFNDFVITSMMRGKKIVHLFEKPAFTYLPGETAIAAGNEPMVIDFPEASELNPTQCVALAIASGYINDTLGYLNNHYNSDPDIKHNWKLQFNQYHFNNDAEITDIINKLIRICSSSDTAKNIYADLNLKELLIRLVQSQHMIQTASEASEISNRTRLHYILNYIHENLTGKIAVDTLSRKAYMSRNDFFKWFRQQFGITPLDYINSERIKLAKQLLSYGSHSITEVSYRCGFSDVNYFVRLFKKVEGITPKVYKDLSCMRID